MYKKTLSLLLSLLLLFGVAAPALAADDTSSSTPDPGPGKFTILFDVNGGDLANGITPMKEVEIKKGATYELLADDAVTRTGYKFLGWYDSKTSGTQIKATTFIPKDKTEITLYAHWEREKYTITLHTAEGYFDNNTTVKEKKVELSFEDPYSGLPKPQREGYEFDKWLDAAGGNAVPDTTTASKDSKTDLWASWKARTYKVSFAYNYPNDSIAPSPLPAAPSSLDVVHGSTYPALPTPNPSNAPLGYQFEGWYADRAATGTKIAQGVKVEITAAQTLYAKWNKTHYVVTLNYTDGVAGTNPTHLTYAIPAPVNTPAPTPETPAPSQDPSTSPPVTNRSAAPRDSSGPTYGPLPTPSLQGHTFNGWYKTQNPSPSASPVAAADVVTGDHTLYANWTASTHKVTFDLGYSPAPTAPAAKTVNYGSYVRSAFPSPAPERAGYTFDGWYFHQGANGETHIKVKDTDRVTDDVTLYAHWVSSNSVRLEVEGGELPAGTPSTINVSKELPYPTLPTPTRKGYSFQGWFTHATEGVQITSGQAVGDTIPVALYARWAARTFTVSFDFNGASGSREPKVYTYGSNYTNLPAGPRWDGRTFLGWFTEREHGKGVQVTSTTAITIAENHTLYAHWGYKISFDPTTGSGSMEDAYAPVDGSFTLPECTYTPPNGQSFYRWAVGTLKGEQLAVGAQQTFTRNTTLYAIWKETPITITATCTTGGSLGTTEGATNEVVVDRGSDVTFIARANYGYELEDVIVDGVSCYAMESYTFRSVVADHTIHAIFRRIPDPGYTNCQHGLSCPLSRYSDLNTYEWYHDAVHYCMDEVLMTGVSETRYNPSAHADRATLATVLWRAEGCPNAVGGGALARPFKDVNTTAWYYKSVAWAAKEGVVEGYSNGKFGPQDKVTREQVVTMLWRYAGKPAPSQTRLPYYDSWAIHDYAWDAMCWATEKGVINGRANGNLDPRGYATRAEIAQLLMNYFQNMD